MMKKIYEMPDLEINKFTLTSDILIGSSPDSPEGDIPSFDGGTVGFGFPD